MDKLICLWNVTIKTAQKMPVTYLQVAVMLVRNIFCWCFCIEL